MSNRIGISTVLLIGGVMAWNGLAAAGWSVPDDPADAIAIEAGAIAQTAPSPSGYTVIHVNSNSGSDSQGNGSQFNPYQTISYALTIAEENTLILLSAGTYSAESGETFPIQLKPRVTIQGMAGPNIAEVIIRGNGGYVSEANGVRNIAILGAHNAGLANVMVSNPHPEGIGLWIESGSPIIRDNAFFRNGLSGIYIAGNGAPLIQGNYFGENGQAGLVIAGPSSAAVEANVFENTGAGITVAPAATPRITNNRISSNLDGLILHADSRPTLADNHISRNRRNSIVDYAVWSGLPSIATATATQPPPPSRSEEAISVSEPTDAAGAAIAPSQTIPPPPSPSSEETAPTVQSTGIAAPNAPLNVASPAPTTISAVPLEGDPATAAEAPPEAAETLDDRLETTTTATNSVPLPVRVALGGHIAEDLTDSGLALSTINIETPIAAHAGLEALDFSPVVAAAATLSSNFEPEVVAATAVGGMVEETATITAPLPRRSDRAEPGDRAPSVTTEASTPEAIAIPIIPPPVDTVAKPSESPLPLGIDPSPTDVDEYTQTTGDLPELPPVSANTTTGLRPLRVPGGEIPVGSGGELPEVLAPEAPLFGEGPPPPPSLATSLGLNYKVLVAAPDQASQAQVRAHVADAFRTRLRDRLYMQVGAYPTLEEAQAQVERLQQVGIQAQIEEIP